MKRLQNELKLEIDDYTDIAVLRDNVKIYNTLLSEYLERQSSPMIIHSPRG